MADSLGFNKIAGAVLATGLVIVGLQQITRIAFEPKEAAKQGYAIAIQEDTSGGEAADVIPDWGTVLPTANIAHGQSISAKCQACHILDASGANNIGPGLYGVVGRPPGTHAGFSYDQAMGDFAAKNKAWTYDLLYQFLKSPQGFMPGTKMTFAGLPAPQDRIDLIAYLRSNGSPTYPIPAPNPKAAASNSASNATASNSASNAAPAANAAK
jgi:cytochrome c